MMDTEMVDEVQARGLDVVAREQLHRVLGDCLPGEVGELRNALAEGRVDGSRYWSETYGCGCVLGTIAHARGERGDEVGPAAMEFAVATVYALEDWAHLIAPSDLPDLLADEDTGAFRAASLMQWIDEFEAQRVGA
jgi:hypothetical protein